MKKIIVLFLLSSYSYAGQITSIAIDVPEHANMPIKNELMRVQSVPLDYRTPCGNLVVIKPTYKQAIQLMGHISQILERNRTRYTIGVGMCDRDVGTETMAELACKAKDIAKKNGMRFGGAACFDMAPATY
jgi:hypothetical protein